MSSLLKKCPQCKLVKRTTKFCGDCGVKLEEFDDANGVWKPEGLWQITTYSDEEGRKPPTQLGVHEGHIVDLARRFSSESNYSLTFIPAESLELIKRHEPRPSVEVQLSTDSQTYSLSEEDRVQYFRKMLKGCKDVEVVKSSQYGCVRFNFRNGIFQGGKR